MSALKVWDLLEDFVSDPDLHTKIRNLLIVQVIVFANLSRFIWWMSSVNRFKAMCVFSCSFVLCCRVLLCV